ncbi:hypothetical protein KPL47_04680 [Clostridium estertheticum]|uniref:hypothetical protein n=1 Tax=Clostridium estertheticum TaxID=238834 RepID=UPI001C0E2CC9|nr:hypothetical protein [Clostridium estertheticum]MBU3175657.1 hypothetical protein [Clostridium estertheticum]
MKAIEFRFSNNMNNEELIIINCIKHDDIARKFKQMKEQLLHLAIFFSIINVVDYIYVKQKNKGGKK